MCVLTAVERFDFGGRYPDATGQTRDECAGLQERTEDAVASCRPVHRPHLCSSHGRRHLTTPLRAGWFDADRPATERNSRRPLWAVVH